jgi:hypothetical protein
MLKDVRENSAVHRNVVEGLRGLTDSIDSSLELLAGGIVGRIDSGDHGIHIGESVSFYMTNGGDDHSIGECLTGRDSFLSKKDTLSRRD